MPNLSLQENLSIGFKIIHFMRDVLKIERSNASKLTVFVEDLVSGVAARSPDPSGYAQYEALLPKHHAQAALIRKREDEYNRKIFREISPSELLSAGNQPALKLLGEVVFKLIGLSVMLGSKSIYGGCTEFCNIIVGILLLKKIPFEVIGSKCTVVGCDYDHQFMVLGRKLGSDLRNIATWGEDAVILDAWDQFKCVAARQALLNPSQYPFFAIKHREKWSWHLMLSYPFDYPVSTTQMFKRFCEQKIADLVKKYIPENFNLSETTTDPQQLLLLCGTPTQPMSHHILSRAIQCHQYDYYRLEVSRAACPDMDVAHLQMLSYVVGKGVTKDLIVVTDSKVSINRLWLDHQLQPEKRNDILVQAKIRCS